VAQHGAIDPVSAYGVDIDEVGDVVVGEGFDVPHIQVTGVVDHDIETAVTLDHSVHGRVGGRLRGDVERDDVQIGPGVASVGVQLGGRLRGAVGR
jgi:hypothetical protein